VSGIHTEIVDNPAWTDGRVGEALGQVLAGLICLFSQDRSKFTTSFVSRVFADSGFSMAMINSQIRHDAGGYCLKGSTFLSKGIVMFPYDVYLFNKLGLRRESGRRRIHQLDMYHQHLLSIKESGDLRQRESKVGEMAS
jgi:hypothetical protein